MRARALVPMLLVMAAAAAQAGGVDTTVGRQVPARTDAPSLAAASHARAAYVLHCAGCHGLQGQGAPEAYVPDLRQLGHFLRVPGGREFVLKVPGVMGSGLDDAQVAEVANWLLATVARATAPAGEPAFSRAEVHAARHAPLLDVAAERRRLQQAARAQGLVID